jgi:hypothetical protein
VPPLIPRSKRLRTALLAGISIVLVVAVALLLASTADNGGKHQTVKAKAKAKKEKARVAAKSKAVKLVLGRVVVQSTGLPAAVKPPVRRIVLRATQHYFDAAIQTPVRSGRVDNTYKGVFDPGLKGLATRKDRTVLTESATRSIVRKSVGMRASKVRIDALGDPTGKIALVATTFNLNIEAKTSTGRKLVIRRRTELTFAYEFGRWVVTAYQVNVRRSVAGNTTSTTAHSAPATTA